MNEAETRAELIVPTKLSVLLSRMFQPQAAGIEELGGDPLKTRDLFIEFQQYFCKTA